jgi:hypothetical protein
MLTKSSFVIWNLAAVIAISLFVSAPVYADVVILKDGSSVEGEVVEKGDTYEVKSPYGTMTIRKSDVQKVSKEAGTIEAESAPASPLPAIPPAVAKQPAVTDLAPPVAPPPKPSSTRSPVPSVEQLKKAEKLVRDLYKDLYSKQDKRWYLSLASFLLQDGLSTKSDPAVRFFMLRESLNLSGRFGDVEIAFRAMDTLEREFNVDAKDLRWSTLNTLGKSVQEASSNRLLALACQQVAEKFVAENDFESAIKLLGAAETCARKVKESAIAAQAASRVKEIQETHTEHNKIKPAAKILAEMPDDPGANLAMGKFLCFIKGDWSNGIPLLMKGNDPSLKALATMDREGSADVNWQITMGDGWWELAEKLSGLSKVRGRDRALHWYKQAWKNISGINREVLRGKFRTAQKRHYTLPPKPLAKMPEDWHSSGDSGDQIALDTTYAYTGQHSVCLSLGQKNVWIRSNTKPVTTGQEYIISAMVLTEKCEGARWCALIWKGGGGLVCGGPSIPADQPWWSPIEMKVTIPNDRETLNIHFESGAGKIWIDDVSIRPVNSSSEMLLNGSFEK